MSWLGLTDGSSAVAQVVLRGQVEREQGAGVLNLVQRKYSILTNFQNASPFVLRVDTPQLNGLIPNAPTLAAGIRIQHPVPVFLIDGKSVDAAVVQSPDTDGEPAPFPLRITQRHFSNGAVASFDGVRFTYSTNLVRRGSTFVIDGQEQIPGAAADIPATAADIPATASGAVGGHAVFAQQFAPAGAIDGNEIPMTKFSKPSQIFRIDDWKFAQQDEQVNTLRKSDTASPTDSATIVQDVTAHLLSEHQRGALFVDGEAIAATLNATSVDGKLVVPVRGSVGDFKIDGQSIINVSAKLSRPQLNTDSDSAVMQLASTEVHASVKGELVPKLAPMPRAPVSWDEWYMRFAELVKEPLVNAMLDADSPHGAGTIRVLVTSEHKITVRIEKSANVDFDAAVIRGCEGLQGNVGLQFPENSRRSFVSFLTDHTFADDGDCVNIAVKPLREDKE